MKALIGWLLLMALLAVHQPLARAAARYDLRHGGYGAGIAGLLLVVLVVGMSAFLVVMP